MKSAETSALLLKRYGILATPGVGLGFKYGEGHVRLSLTIPTERCAEAVKRLRRGGL